MKYWIVTVCQFKCYNEEHVEICVLFIFSWLQGLGNFYSCWREEICGLRWPGSHLWRQDNCVVLFDFTPSSPFGSGSVDRGSFGKMSDEARIRVGGVKIEWGKPLVVWVDCWREFHVECHQEVPIISSGELSDFEHRNASWKHSFVESVFVFCFCLCTGLL